MAKLIVNPTSSSRREIPLARSLMSIGRDPSNDLVLPDAMVSRRHAVIEFRSSQYYLRDCNSSNGSLVNGDRVSERNLRDGDLVAIGTARLLFRDEPDVVDAEAKVVQHPSAPRLECPACHADFRKGDLFCRQCGKSLADLGPPKLVCVSCGTVVPLPANFCNACGAGLAKDKPERSLEPTRPRPVGEGQAPSDPAEPEASAASNGEPRPHAVPAAPAELGEIGITPQSVPVVSLPAEDDARPAPTLDPDPPAPAPRPPMSAGSAAPALVVPMFRPTPQPGRLRLERSLDSARRPGPRAVSLPARLGPRFVAGMLDAVAVGLIQALALAPAWLYWTAHPEYRAPSDVAFLPIAVSLGLVPLALVLGAGYYVYFWGIRGATPGKSLFGLAVETEHGTQPIGVRRAALRALGYALSGLVLGIGFVMILFGGRALHDHIAGTRVVRRGGA